MNKYRTARLCHHIPARSRDWCARFEGYTENDPAGFGQTEAAAIADLEYEALVSEGVEVLEAICKGTY